MPGTPAARETDREGYPNAFNGNGNIFLARKRAGEMPACVRLGCHAPPRKKDRERYPIVIANVLFVRFKKWRSNIYYLRR